MLHKSEKFNFLLHFGGLKVIIIIIIMIIIIIIIIVIIITLLVWCLGVTLVMMRYPLNLRHLSTTVSS